LSTREQSDSEQVRLLQQQVEQLSADLEQANLELASAQHQVWSFSLHSLLSFLIIQFSLFDVDLQTEEVSAQLRSTAQSLTESSKKEQNLTEALQRVSERNDVLVASLQKSKEECQQYQTQVPYQQTLIVYCGFSFLQ
jgi:large-conductance mechanosensitive channel